MNSEATRIHDLGAIESFELPSGWVEAPQPEPIGGRILRKFHIKDRQEVRFCSYERTVTLSRPDAQTFQQALYSEFHNLSQEELDSLQPILEGMANATHFQITEAGTGYVNSRRVLRVTGRWLKNQEQTLCLFVDTKGDGELVHQIYFTAPAAEFEQYWAQVDALFLSIAWKR